MEFGKFRRSLLSKGFRQIGTVEFRNQFDRLGLEAPRHREGREVGFTMSANGLDVFVWTTILCSTGEARDEDAGWILICCGDKRWYTSHPHSRTKNYLEKMKWEAHIARWRVENRPLCPEEACKAFMKIAHRHGNLKSCLWRCDERHRHSDRRPRFRGWDHGLPPAALEYLTRVRKARARYAKELRKVGRRQGAAMARRNGWKITKPHNLRLPM